MKKETIILALLATTGVAISVVFLGPNRSNETQVSKQEAELPIQELPAIEPLPQTETPSTRNALPPAPQTLEAANVSAETPDETLEALTNPLSSLIPSSQEEPISEPAPPKGLPSDAWSNVGTGDALSSLETLLWAGNNGEFTIASDMVRWNETDSASELSDIDSTKKKLVETTTKWIKNLDSFDVFINEQLDDSTRRVVVGFETPNGPEARGITFIKEGADWFPLMNISGGSDTWNHTSFEGAPKSGN